MFGRSLDDDRAGNASRVPRSAEDAGPERRLQERGAEGEYSAQRFEDDDSGIATPTPFGFGGWVALTRGTAGTDVMMGDVVLTQEEVNPVMSALLENGIGVTALHNHF